MRASAGSDFDSLFNETVKDLEASVVRVVLVGSVIALGLTLGALTSASVVSSAHLFTVLGYLGWYLCTFLLLRTGRFRPWMRYISSLVDVSAGSVVLLVDLHSNPLFAISASAPLIYALGIVIAMLRLDPRLCIFAGASAAAQLLGVTLLVVRPLATPEMLAAGALNPFIIVFKTLFLLAMGMLGSSASRSMRRLLRRLTESAAERERVRGILGMHVSEQVMEHLLSGGIREGGERRAITVCFTDIRDFTSLSESRPPEEVLALLNLYFGRMCGIVAAHGGLVNKFLGDGMLIVFGAPAAQPDDAHRALAAARAMLEETVRMRESGEFPGLRIGIGLHRGEAVVGNVGGAQRQEYTAIGDTVNTASRVQDLTKTLGCPLLLTRECRDALGEDAFLSLGIHTVKGRLQPLELFGMGEADARRAA